MRGSNEVRCRRNSTTNWNKDNRLIYRQTYMIFELSYIIHRLISVQSNVHEEKIGKMKLKNTRQRAFPASQNMVILYKLFT